MKPPEDKKLAKLRKQRIASLTEALNKARINVSMHHHKTYGDVMLALGISDDDMPALASLRATPVDVQGFNNNVANPLYERLSQKIKQEIDGTSTTSVEQTNSSPRIQDVQIHRSLPRSGASTTKRSDSAEEDVDRGQHHPIDSIGWWLPDPPTKRCTLFKHQTKAAKDLAYQLIIQKYRASLLRAGVGVGKTFIFYEFISQLWQHNWFNEVKCFSPWPVLIVTRASIVEQTRRVGVEQYGLDPYKQFKVINYDGLRASAGKHMIMDETIVEDGVPRKKWSWYPGVHPKVFILDECQSAKNEQSQQSQICQSIAKIDDPDVKVICSSATPFTRVSESKYFVINADITYSII